MIGCRMDFEDPAPLSLDGSLLLADPSLMDSNFKRAVLYLNHHSAEAGAEGFVLIVLRIRWLEIFRWPRILLSWTRCLCMKEGR